MTNEFLHKQLAPFIEKGGNQPLEECLLPKQTNRYNVGTGRLTLVLKRF